MKFKRFLQQMVSVTFIALFLIVGSATQTHATEVSSTPTPTPAPTPTPTPVPPTPIPQPQKQDESNNIPEEYKVTITGRLINKEKDTEKDWRVTVVKVDEQGNATFEIRFDAAGRIKFLYSCLIDNDGKFMIVADRRYWEKTGKFSLKLDKELRTGLLQDLNNIPIVITLDKNTKKIELGDVVVSRDN